MRRHLAGELPLAVSFWLNLVLLSALYYGLEPLVLTRLSGEPVLFVAGTLTFVGVASTLVFPWQAIGLLRSADNHYRRHRDPVVLRTVQGVTLVAGSLILVHIVDTAQSLVAYRNDLEYRTASNGDVGYRLEVSGDGRLLEISGSLDHGITHDVRALLANEHTVEGVVLSSLGGQIYEGRGLARAIQQHALATYVLEECSSACATAFLGGQTRHLAKDAKLGFHRYKLETTRLRQFARFYDIEAEQRKDLAFYGRQGVSKRFQEAIFARPDNAIWYPGHEALVANGVAHTSAATAERRFLLRPRAGEDRMVSPPTAQRLLRP